MENLIPSMKLKLNSDVVILPDEDGSVYFRNNERSFRMEGKTVSQWIERLLPVFSGRHTLKSLTDGLPKPYSDRIYEIASAMYNNGFVRDVSNDSPHQLTSEVERSFASQIELLDNLLGSGASHFEVYRKAKILAVGDGPCLASLVAALFQSGHPNVQFLTTGKEPTNRERFKELLNHARRFDADATLNEVKITPGTDGWRKAVEPFDVVLYISQNGDFEDLENIQSFCDRTRQSFLPAIFVNQVGIAGPLIHPENSSGWEASWHRLHKTVFARDPALHCVSVTARALLANVVVFELFKTVTGISTKHETQFYLLNLETLEGAWHSYLPHPEIGGHLEAMKINVNERLARDESEAYSFGVGETLEFFGQITDDVSGIFHVWDEGELNQLPLSQCRVRVACPFSDGPADVLPDVICRGMTHEEARRSAGLTGMEEYARRLLSHMSPFHQVTENHSTLSAKSVIGIGAGLTFSECALRGLQTCLRELLEERNRHHRATMQPVELKTMELRTVADERCHFYLETFAALSIRPTIGYDQDVFGFPVVWVEVDGRHFSGVGVNITVALQAALEDALMAQIGTGTSGDRTVRELEEIRNPSDLTFMVVADTEAIEIPAEVPTMSGGAVSVGLIRSAMETLKLHGVEPIVFDLSVEPFMTERLAGVFAVVLRWEEKA